jgi:hypothetical protein
VRIRTTSIADADVAESALFLEQTQPGLGSTFLDAVDATFASIVAAPLACPTIVLPDIKFKFPLRFKQVDRFPYRVIFTVVTDEAAVVSVLHSNRDLEFILRARVGVS